MNYMGQVARMLGVELKESFKPKGYDDIYKITEKGLFFLWVVDADRWVKEDLLVLCEILTGDAEIIKSPSKGGV